AEASGVGSLGGYANYAMRIERGVIRNFGTSFRIITNVGTYSDTEKDDYILVHPNQNSSSLIRINLQSSNVDHGKTMIIHNPVERAPTQIHTNTANKFNNGGDEFIGLSQNQAGQFKVTYDKVNNTWWWIQL